MDNEAFTYFDFESQILGTTYDEDGQLQLTLNCDALNRYYRHQQKAYERLLDDILRGEF